MRRVSVDIGGTFTDCFVAWDEHHVQAKALTTHQNLAIGFNEALDIACAELEVPRDTLLAGLDSVRYATTLGTNALIERRGPRVGLLITEGFNSTVPLARGRGYAEGLSHSQQMDVPNAQRPEPLVPIPMIQTVRERIGFRGDVLMSLDEADLRDKIRTLVERGAEAVVVLFAHSVVNPVHELRAREVFLEAYPAHYLGSIPILLSHQVAGRKGEYVRASSTIMDAYLHATMYFGLGTLEMNLRSAGYTKPMLINHNSGGMAQLNSTDALQTLHSGPVSGIAAAEHLMLSGELGNVVATDMGGTSFDIGLVTDGGVKHYDFNPVIERWLVSVPMVHLVTLGAGGGSIASYDRMYNTVKVGPKSAGSDPGPACYDRGGMHPTVTDADLLLGYFDPQNYAAGRIKLNPRRSRQAMEEALCDELDIDVITAAKLVKQTVDNNMANGIATELRSRGYAPEDFTVLTYGGNGPLHACGIARVLGARKILAPPYSSVFSALGAGNVDQLHIHEASTYTVLFHSGQKQLLTDYEAFNRIVADLERRGRDDLVRQGTPAEQINHRLELDMRYGNQRVETAVVTDLKRLTDVGDVLRLLEQFSQRYGERFGEGSQTPEAGVRINTIRVCSYVEHEKVNFSQIKPLGLNLPAPEPESRRAVHFVGHDGAVDTPIYGEAALKPGTVVDGPAIVTTRATTYLVEPGWRFEASHHGAVWFTRP